MKKLLTLCSSQSAVLSLALMSVSNLSYGAFVLTLDDPNDGVAALTIYDLTGSDQNGAPGAITYSGAVGAFTVTVTTGVSKPLIGPASIDLNSIEVSGAAGTLLVGLSDTDFVGEYSAFTASYGGNTQGTLDLSFYHDAGNTEFGGSEFAQFSHDFSTDGLSFSGSDFAGFSVAQPFSLSVMAEITHDGPNKITSFDALVTPVPLPAGGLLFLSAVPFVAWLKRKKA